MLFDLFDIKADQTTEGETTTAGLTFDHQALGLHLEKHMNILQTNKVKLDSESFTFEHELITTATATFMNLVAALYANPGLMRKKLKVSFKGTNNEAAFDKGFCLIQIDHLKENPSFTISGCQIPDEKFGMAHITTTIALPWNQTSDPSVNQSAREPATTLPIKREDTTSQ